MPTSILFSATSAPSPRARWTDQGVSLVYSNSQTRLAVFQITQLARLRCWEAALNRQGHRRRQTRPDGETGQVLRLGPAPGGWSVWRSRAESPPPATPCSGLNGALWVYILWPRVWRTLLLGSTRTIDTKLLFHISDAKLISCPTVPSVPQRDLCVLARRRRSHQKSLMIRDQRGMRPLFTEQGEEVAAPL